MVDLNYLAIVVAAAAALILSAAYYGLLGSQLAQLNDAYADEAAQSRPPAGTLAIELIRSLVVASVIAVLGTQLDITGLPGSLLLAIGLWLGFPVVLWSGSIVHEKYPWKLAAIHAGDWLLKVMIITLIVTLWR